jgi:hypothetical protein
LIQNEPTEQSGVLVCPPLFSSETGMKALFDILAPILSAVPHISVIIDDLSVLEWMGINSKEIRRFLRATLHLMRKVSFDFFLGPHDHEDAVRMKHLY